MEHEKLILHPKRAKGDDGHKIFSIRVKDELVDKLNVLSQKTGYSRNELICMLLEYAVEHCSISDE